MLSYHRSSFSVIVFVSNALSLVCCDPAKKFDACMSRPRKKGGLVLVFDLTIFFLLLILLSRSLLAFLKMPVKCKACFALLTLTSVVYITSNHKTSTIAHFPRCFKVVTPFLLPVPWSSFIETPFPAECFKHRLRWRFSFVCGHVSSENVACAVRTFFSEPCE